ncbi:hypothetical protein L7F22_050475 [Adiantum nelumboides]|nr:hypothetical protein [Adiantum nelumboides]
MVYWTSQGNTPILTPSGGTTLGGVIPSGFTPGGITLGDITLGGATPFGDTPLGASLMRTHLHKHLVGVVRLLVAMAVAVAVVVAMAVAVCVVGMQMWMLRCKCVLYARLSLWSRVHRLVLLAHLGVLTTLGDLQSSRWSTDHGCCKEELCVHHQTTRAEEEYGYKHNIFSRLHRVHDQGEHADWGNLPRHDRSSAAGEASATDEENKIEDEGDMSQATQQVLSTIDEETPFHKGDAMSTQEVVEHESDFAAQKPSNDMNKGSENMLPTIGETQIHEGNTRNSEEKMVVVENQRDVQTSPKPSDDIIIKDTYNMPLRDEEVEGSEKKDEANEEHQGALATTEVQDKVDKGTRKATRNANKAQSIQGRMQGTEGEEREIQERLRREEEAQERKILEHLRREEEGEERKILERLKRQEEEEAQKKEEPTVHYKRPRRCKYLDPYFMDEL